jgi:GT2 family glycosyltransferase
MLFSVIIPTCNRNNMLELCLNRLAPGAQSLNAEHYDVIVTDDGRKENAKLLIAEKYPWVKWVEGPKKGPAANRNNGAKYASGKWLVFTDDDCLPDINWLAAFANAIQQHAGVKAFEGAILPDNRELLKKDMAECPVNEHGGCFWSANIMVEKMLFDSIGGFDERFKIAAQEDEDLFDRLKTKTATQFAPEAYVIHPVRFGSLKKRIGRIGITTINWHKYYRKQHNFLGTLVKGLSSQSLAFIAAIKKQRVKSAIFSFAYLISIVPFLLYAEIKSVRV